MSDGAHYRLRAIRRLVASVGRTGCIRRRAGARRIGHLAEDHGQPRGLASARHHHRGHGRHDAVGRFARRHSRHSADGGAAGADVSLRLEATRSLKSAAFPRR